MVLTKQEAVELVAAHLDTENPIDCKGLDRRCHKSTLEQHVLIDGEQKRRIVVACRHNKTKSKWFITVWRSWHAWQQNKGTSVFVVEWPAKISKFSRKESKKLAPKIPKPIQRDVYLTFQIWWRKQLTAIGDRWFEKGRMTHVAKHMVKTMVMAEVVRTHTKNPTAHLRPRVLDSMEIAWDVISYDSTIGSASTELLAWENAAKKLNIDIPTDAKRPWRPPTKIS